MSRRVHDAALDARIFSALRGAIGSERAINARALAALTGTDERTVRHAVAARASEWSVVTGRPLCTTPGTGNGFFFADDADDAARHAMKLHRLEAAARDKRMRFETLLMDIGLGELIPRAPGCVPGEEIGFDGAPRAEFSVKTATKKTATT